MEVYIPSIPSSITKNQLRLEVYPALHHVARAATNFMVQIWSRRSGGGFQASITLPDERIGEQFLAHVSESPLVVGGHELVCHRSEKRVDPKLVEKLRRETVLSPTIELERIKWLKELKTPIKFSSLEFGRLCGDNVFSPEHVEDARKGKISFIGDSHQLVVTFSKAKPAVFISFSSLRRLHLLPSTPPSILMELMRPPRYEFNVNEKDRLGERHSALNSTHRLIAGYVSTQLRIVFPTEEDLNDFQHRRVQVHLPRILDSTISVEPRRLYSPRVLDELETGMGLLDFRVAFQLDLLLKNGIVDASSLLTLMPKVCRLASTKTPEAMEQILANLGGKLVTEAEDKAFSLATGDHTYARSYLHSKRSTSPSLSAKLDSSVYQTPQQSSHLAGTRHVTLCASTMFLDGPCFEQSNRILRDYPPHQFLRLTVRDEDFEKYDVVRRVDMRRFLEERYGKIFAEGLWVGGRRFEFVGWSMSGLKDHSVYLVSPFHQGDTLVDASFIRRSLGNFSKVAKIPSLYLARVAQAFSTSHRTVDLDPEEVEVMDDIMRNGFTFTDGVGSISEDLAEDVLRCLGKVNGISYNLSNATCFQIRFGSAKGVVALDRSLTGRILRLRKSMLKFEDPTSRSLDVVTPFSRPFGAFLNRPLVKILEDLGTPYQAFHKLQMDAVLEVEEGRKSLVGASRLLERVSLGRVARLSRTLNHLRLALESSSTSKCFDTPFVQNCIELAVIKHLRDLKFCARIPIPNSWSLVGIADIHGYLASGQIYACISEQGKKKFCLKGQVMISRSPTIHPGDVRIVEAIGDLPLGSATWMADQVNCVVFDTTGERPIPDMLGGGDLDGDTYLCSQHTPIFPTGGLFPPAEYTAEPPHELQRPCDLFDIQNFFFDFMTSDFVGVIANRHLQIADRSDRGVFDRRCLELARYHSTAVDFPKKGQPIDASQLPKADPPSDLKPDFLGHGSRDNRDDDQFYQSFKALGKLFRMIPLSDVEASFKPAETSSANSEVFDELEVSLVDFEAFETVTRDLSALFQEKHPSLASPDEKHVSNISHQLLPWFTESLLRIAFLYSLSRQKGSHLSEEEVFMGEISLITKSKMTKKTAVNSLHEKTSVLVSALRTDLRGSGTKEEQISRCWAGWNAVVRKPSEKFGLRSFAWICLGLILDDIEELRIGVED